MTAIPLRITVLDTWDEVRLAVPTGMTVAEVKSRALDAAQVAMPPGDYLLKFRGAEVPEEATVAEAGLVPNGALIVLPRRRIPAR